MLVKHQGAFERAHKKVLASSWWDKDWLCKTGLWPDAAAPEAVVLKLSKAHWSQDSIDAIRSTSGLFFSVWIDADALKKGRLRYNLHALKLRQLKQYNLESRKFAEAFRKYFQPLSSTWPNVQTAFGPQTLFEGFIEASFSELEGSIAALAVQFCPLGGLIDELLSSHANPASYSSKNTV